MNAKRKNNKESDGCNDAKERAHKRQQLSSTKEKTEEKSVQPSLPPFKKEDDESEVPVLSKREDAEDESEKDAEDESEKEESDLEEQCCDECGRYVDPFEELDEDGWCLECNKKMQVNNVRSYLPGGYDIREVSGSHRKPCYECGKNDWFYGDYYVFDASQPWGTAKYCLDCAETKFRYGSDEDDY